MQINEIQVEDYHMNDIQMEDISEDDSDSDSDSDIEMKGILTFIRKFFSAIFYNLTEDEDLKQLFGDIEEYQETTFDTPFDDFLQSDRYSGELKFNLCQHIIKRAVFRCKQLKTANNNKQLNNKWF